MNQEKLSIALDSFWLPRQASNLAPEIDFGWTLAKIVAYVFFALVVGAMIVFVVKFRRRSDRDRTSALQHNTALEIGWSVGPLIILMACFLVGFQGYLASSVAPAGAYEIAVTAQKWNWQFTYPNGVVTNELVVPEDRPVKLVMSSRDVLHSVFIPEFRVKQDVIPRQYTTLWFTATEPGETVLLCTEYCGLQHSEMLSRVRVLAQDDFGRWLDDAASAAGGSPAQQGEKLFTMYCSACHTVDGTRRVGPALNGLAGRQTTLVGGQVLVADENYLRESILTPATKIVEGYPNAMSPFQGVLNDSQVDAVIAYLKSLE